MLDDLDREALLKRLERTVVRHGWSCFAYCLLDTHFHLVVRTPEPNLGYGMQWLLAPYARDFNERYERRGNLFHTRFYSTRITNDEHLVAALVYVYLNPVRAGIVETPDLWPWSTYAATIGEVAASAVSRRIGGATPNRRAARPRRNSDSDLPSAKPSSATVVA